MMLHAQHMPGQPGAPSLVFLHGFSGDCREWQPVGEQFHGCSRLYIDLPGHGGSAAIPVGGFADVIRLLRATLISYNIPLQDAQYCINREKHQTLKIVDARCYSCDEWQRLTRKPS